MYLTGQGADFTLSTMSRTFKLHKAILTAHSPVMAALFDNKLKEKPKRNLWKFKDEVLDLLFKYMYTGKLIMDTPCLETVLSLLAAADAVSV